MAAQATRNLTSPSSLPCNTLPEQIRRIPQLQTMFLKLLWKVGGPTEGNKISRERPFMAVTIVHNPPRWHSVNRSNDLIKATEEVLTGDPLHSRAACTQPCNVNTHSRAHCSPGARLCEQWEHGCVNNGARLCASARLSRGSPVVLRHTKRYPVQMPCARSQLVRGTAGPFTCLH